MAFATPEWRPVRVVAVESWRSGPEAEGGGPEGNGDDAEANGGDRWIDELASAITDADDLVLERLDPDATLERLAETCVGIDPDPDRVDCLVTPADPGGRETADFVAAVRERNSDVPVIVHPETGSVAEAADATAAGADRYLARTPPESGGPTDGDRAAGSAADRRAELLAAVRELAADHDEVRRDLLGQQLLHAILDDLQLVLFFKDREGRHVCASAQVANSHDESVIGKTDLDLYEREAGDAAREAYQDDLAVARQGERIVEKEEYFPTANSGANWLQTTKVPWTGPDGTRLGSIGITEPINEWKAREAELQQERRRLEAFASFVSHDLRNPVSIASGYLDLAREGGDPTALGKVEGALERMDGLIDDVLTLVEPGGPDEPLDWLSLRRAVEDAWHHVDAPEATLSVSVPERVEVLAAEGLLDLLLQNVLKNAVQHGGPGVAIEVGCTPDGFYVADDGPGIDADEPSRVFEYGYTEGGTGLGLAIVTEVAAHHRWEPTVDDWVGDRSASEGTGAAASAGSADSPGPAESAGSPESTGPDEPTGPTESVGPPAPTAADSTSLPAAVDGRTLPATDDVGAFVEPPEARGYDGACFRFGHCILRTPAHRNATAGDPVAPTESADVGDPTMAGDASRLAPGSVEDADGDPVGPDAWRVDGVGKNFWRNLEEYHLAYANVHGDVRVVARLAALDYASEYSKAGVLVGRWPSAGEPLAFLGSVGVHGCESIHRPDPSSVLSIRNHADRTAIPIWLRLDRVGDRVTSYCSADGETWTPVDQHVLALEESVVAGLAVCSHDEGRRSAAMFDHVRITPLSPPTE